jgi:hypothetical protein
MLARSCTYTCVSGIDFVLSVFSSLPEQGVTDSCLRPTLPEQGVTDSCLRPTLPEQLQKQKKKIKLKTDNTKSIPLTHVYVHDLANIIIGSTF